MNVGLTLIAAFLDGLKDSHTNFQPPARSYSLEYGYRLIVIGDDVYVERVKEGSDAGAKALGARRPPIAPITAAESTIKGNGRWKNASAANAATAIATCSGWRNARRPMRQAACATMATTTGLMP